MWVQTTWLAAGVLFAHPAQACRLALVLAIDVSSSVDATEDALQRQGLAEALIDPQVSSAFFANADPVAITIFEWSGRYNQVSLVPWTLIKSPGQLVTLSRNLAASQRSHNDFPTAMGYALGHAAGLLQTSPACLFQTVDVAGDGINNEGFGPTEAYTAFPFRDVTVNGLVVNAADFEGEVGLISFYRNEVIRGPGAFIEIATTFDDYAAAIRRKLIRELDVQVLGALPDTIPSNPDTAG